MAALSTLRIISHPDETGLRENLIPASETIETKQQELAVYRRKLAINDLNKKSNKQQALAITRRRERISRIIERRGKSYVSRS
ncbi:MAG: hypothetical protein HLUCCO03_10125 [Marinobacter sp. HL-58]|nr:MAG: hypothetical protein HLUCCO03_10125 [Marinobacter sp. HL-58]